MAAALRPVEWNQIVAVSIHVVDYIVNQKRHFRKENGILALKQYQQICKQSNWLFALEIWIELSKFCCQNQNSQSQNRGYKLYKLKTIDLKGENFN